MDLVTFDREAMALYVKVSKGRPAKTIPMGKGFFMDVSKDGRALGLEIVFPESTPQEAIDAIIGRNKKKSTQLARAKGIKLLSV